MQKQKLKQQFKKYDKLIKGLSINQIDWRSSEICETFYKQSKKIEKQLKLVDDANVDTTDNEIVINLKYNIDDVAYYDTNDVREIIDNLDYNNKVKTELKKEFNSQRIENCYYHVNDYIYLDIMHELETLANDISVRYEQDNRIELTILIDVELLNDYSDKSIKELYYYYDNLAGIVKKQKEIIKEFCKNIRKIRDKVKELESYIKVANKLLLEAHKNQIIADMELYVEQELILETQDISKIKLDYIKEIKDDKIITNQNAIVPLSEARKILTKFKNGENVINDFIGNFKILKMFEIKNMTLIRIGCHLIKIDDNLINQLKC